MRLYPFALAGIALFSSTCVLATEIKIVDEEESAPYWEFLLLGGTASLDADNTVMTLYDYLASDKLKQNNSGDWNSWTVQAGLGYAIPLFGAERFADEVQWFPMIEPQINAYYLKGNINGVDDLYYQYDEDIDDPNYKIDLESTRLMFDVALTVVSYRNLSIYGLAGIGPSWNRVGFHLQENECYPEPLNLSKHTDTNFAYEFGAGISYSLSEHLSLTAEYLYVGFNNIQLGETGHIGSSTPLADVDSEDFNLNSQAAMAGFRFAF